MTEQTKEYITDQTLDLIAPVNELEQAIEQARLDMILKDIERDDNIYIKL